jgi:hypothetical protein
MSKGIIIGADGKHRRDLVLFFAKHDLPCLPCDCIADLPTKLASDPTVRFVLCLADLRMADHAVRQLAHDYRKLRILIEIEDDTAETALSYVLDYGVYYVVPKGTMRLSKLSQILSEAVGGNPIPNFNRLVDENVTSLADHVKSSWGFMSMNWDDTHTDGHDYNSGVLPAMKRLGVALQRMDAFYANQQGIRHSIELGIRSRKVVVAMLSPPNVMYEVATAYAVKNPVILLYRESGRGELSANRTIPAVLRGEGHIAYSSKCELALKLYFGLGGKACIPVAP